VEVLKKRAYNFRWATVPEGVIPFTAADPDFPAASAIQEALHDYVKSGPLSYGPADGLPEFREAVARYLLGKGISGESGDHAKRILATDGAASALFLTVRAMLAVGEEAVVSDPVDFLFEAAVEAAGGQVRRVPFSRERGIDLEVLQDIVSPRTRLICLCSPHNPFGRLLRREELEVVARLADENDVYILSDEIWSDITYESHHVATASNSIAAPRTFSIGGFSKSFGLAGLRIGYVHAPTEKDFSHLLARSTAQATAYGSTTLSQVAATAALENGQQWLAEFRQHLHDARSLTCSGLDCLPDLDCPYPEATYLATPQIIWGNLDAEQFCEFLIKEAKVAAIPGIPRFFGPGVAGHIRFSFATSLGLIEEALQRIQSVWPKRHEWSES